MGRPIVFNINMSASKDAPATWGMVVESLSRPYRVTIPMVVFVVLVPMYVFIASDLPYRTVYAPAIALDRAIPLQPIWALVYGALYMFLILLPVFVVRHEELLHRTVLAYLSVWIPAYICFLVYPTVSPRPEQLTGEGFALWGLRILYDSDPPYNCFPSLHVAHSFVSALACYRVHRRLGAVAIGSASLIALSTLFTKQHYVADVIAGALMALAAYRVFLHTYPGQNIPVRDRRIAPLFGIALAGIAATSVGAFWLAYMLTGRG